MTELLSPHVSIIVATRDRPDDLARLLKTLLDLQEPAFEVILVVQGDAMPDEDLVANFREIRVFQQDGKGKSRALNLAIRESRAEILAFTDDDCTVPSDWLTNGVNILESNRTHDLVFGNLASFPHNPDEYFVPSITFEDERTFCGPQRRSAGLIGMGANMFARRRLFESIGGFDEDLGPGGPLRTGEECEVAYRALIAGGTVAQSPSVEVMHWGARPWAGGVAAKLVVDGFFAMGAGHGKHARGSLSAVAIAASDVVRHFGRTAKAVIQNSRPTHARSLAAYLEGFGAGLRSGPNWPPITPISFEDA